MNERNYTKHWYDDNGDRLNNKKFINQINKKTKQRSNIVLEELEEFKKNNYWSDYWIGASVERNIIEAIKELVKEGVLDIKEKLK